MPNLYETLLIVTPEADDEGINAVIGDLRSVVEADEGTMLQARIWERNRKLAYQVKGKTEGHYVLLQSEGTTDLPQLLKAKMRLDEAVIRSIVVRLEGPHEAAARKELDELEGDQAAEIAMQKAAAERRAIARAAAATRTTAEVAAEQEALRAEQAAATAAAAPAIIGVDSSEAAPSTEEISEAGSDIEVEAAPADLAPAGDEEPTASWDSSEPGEPTPAEINEESAPQADVADVAADEEEKES